MCDVIKIRLKRRDATRSGKGNQPLNIKTTVERQILRLGLPNFRLSFYSILLLVASLIYRCFLYDVTYATFQCFVLPMDVHTIGYKEALLQILTWCTVPAEGLLLVVPSGEL